VARNPFRVETTIEYRSSLPVSEFHSDTGPLVSPDRPNDCIMEIFDQSGRMTQKLYGRMVFDTLPQAIARIQPREADGDTVVSVTYVMPFFGVLYHRFMQFFCTIWGLGNLLWWLWVLRHGWEGLSPSWRSMLVVGSLLWIGFSVGTFAQLPLSDYPSKLSVWLEEVGKMERLPK
jgi:hypothetical protein